MSRLEEIKQHQWDGYTIWDMSEDDLIWLIKQAERVQELEDIIYKDERQAVLESMYEENKRYREALEKIIEDECTMGRRGMWAETEARKALEGEE